MEQVPVAEHRERPPSSPSGAILGMFGSLVAIIAVGLSAGGEAAKIAEAAIPGAPFAILAWLVQLSDRRRILHGVAWLWFWLLLVGTAGFTVALTYSAMVETPRSPPSPAQARQLALLVVVVVVAFVAALGLLLSRRWAPLAVWMGGRVDPSRATHAMGLVGTIFFIVVACAPLVVLDGEAPLLRLLERNPELGQDRSEIGQILDLYYGLAWNIPLALVMAGLPGRRSLKQASSRLGVLPLRAKDLLALAGCTAGLVVVAIALGALIPALWNALGWRQTDAEAVNRLFGAAISPVGAVSVAISAGVGEELIARGVLQPRFGWFLPNLAFAATHAFQYGSDSLLTVFVIGAGLAAVRARWNTSASMLVHGLYDFTLVVLTLLGIDDP